MKSKLNILLPVSYLILGTILTVLAGSLSFLIAFFCYTLVIKGVSLKIGRENRGRFFNISFLFLLVYSVWTVISHYIFIVDPFSDSYVNIDAFKFFEYATDLSKKGIAGAWKTAFTEFKYSGSPLFYAWMALLKVLSGLEPYYGVLFQKLNVSFLGSFIPGILYLLCTKITDKKRAFKAALTYGFLSFTFFYAVGLMRDIHVALVYAIGLYVIICKKYSLRNFIILILLAVVAYYLRVENGLFFLAFIGVFLLKSGKKNKGVLIVGAIAAAVGVVVLLGGIDNIIRTATTTVGNYSERGVRMADRGSLAVQLKQFPPPFSWIGITAFGQISPFPFWVVFQNHETFIKNLFYLPEAIACLFWFGVWMHIIRYWGKSKSFFKKYKYICLVTILYIIISSIGQPADRRLMAVYPIVFMVYVYVGKRHFSWKSFFKNVGIYGLLIVVYFILKNIL